MQPADILMFGPFRLDLGAERLWRGEQDMSLPPKAFAVLRYLVAHAGKLVTRQALLEAVWGTQYVSDAALASCIRDIRRALGEQAQTPQFLETVRGRGFRFLALGSAVLPSPASLRRPHASGHRPTLVVGRDLELAHLHGCLDKALRGERQVVCITGEPGIGKTTLVDAFLASLTTPQQAWWITGGQCVEHYGVGEAYLPVLEALGRLGQEEDKADVVAVLAQYAPTWLAQLPALVSLPEREGLRHTLEGATQARMLREFADALEVLTTRRPVLVVLEDLHWSDSSTVELLAYVAQRRSLARLLILGTYRPAEAQTDAHPLHRAVQELHARGCCQEVRLGLLQDTAVEMYVRNRLSVAADHASSAFRLATAIHQRTGGNPLFMVTMLEHLLREGVITEAQGQWCMPHEVTALHVELPDTLRQLIEKQFTGLPLEEQQLLEVASVAGSEFAVAAVAAGVDQSVEDVEAQCAAWARRGQFMRLCGTDAWPDGTVAARYGFIHALYRETLYDRVPVSKRVRLHRQIGARLEAGYGPHARDVATELAEHFIQGQDAARGVQYLQYAGEQALHRNAHQEAIRQLTKALQILQTLPDTPERVHDELDVQSVLGPALSATKGYAAPEVAQTYTRLRALAKHVEDRPRLFLALRGLWNCYLMRTEVQMARTLGEQLFHLATHTPTPGLFVEAQRVLGTTLFFQGELIAARTHLEDGITLYDRQQHQALAVHYGADPGVTCRVYAARTLWLLGYPAQALSRGQDALRLARDLGHPFSLGFALGFLTDLLLLRREGHAAQVQNEAGLALAHDYGFPHWVATGMLNRAWCLIAQGQWEAGSTQMSQGMDIWQATGAALEKPLSLATLAEAYGKRGQREKGLSCIAEAHTLVQQTGERWWEAELHRLQGELLLQQATPDVVQGEACFHQALAVARQQQAKSLELRAAMSLSRLWQLQGRRQKARQLLEEVYGWFTEGFDTKDLQEAEALLSALGSQVTRPPSPEHPAPRVEERPITFPASVPMAASPIRPAMPPVVPGPIAAEVTATPAFLFRHEGEYWTIAFQGTICRIKDTFGVRYIAQLLRSPQRELHVLTLVSGSRNAGALDALGAAATTVVHEPITVGATSLGTFTDAGDVLDPQAKAAYKQRLLALQAELEEARSWNDPGRSAILQEEIDSLTQELMRAVGLGGRSRKAASPVERARVNVTRAIRTAINRMTAVHPALGSYLARTIQRALFVPTRLIRRCPFPGSFNPSDRQTLLLSVSHPIAERSP